MTSPTLPCFLMVRSPPGPAGGPATEMSRRSTTCVPRGITKLAERPAASRRPSRPAGGRDRSDVLGGHHHVIEPDPVRPGGLGLAVLARGVRRDVVEEPEPVQLQVHAGPPAEALERLAALLRQV